MLEFKGFFFRALWFLKGQGVVGKESLLFTLQRAISSYVCNVNNKGRNSMALHEMQSKLKLAKQIGPGLTVCILWDKNHNNSNLKVLTCKVSKPSGLKG